MLRLFKWLLIVILLAVAFVLFGLPMLANTEKGRAQLARVLGDGMHRNVAIGNLQIGFLFQKVVVEDFRVANPEGFPPGDLLRAGSVNFDASWRKLLDRQVQGSLMGSGLEFHLIRKGGKTNLDGMFGGAGQAGRGTGGEPGGGGPGGGEPPVGKGPQAPPVDIDVGLKIDDSRLVIEDLDKNEKLVVEGVSLEMTLNNKRGGASDARLKIRVRSVDEKTLRLRDIELDAIQSGDWLDVSNLRAQLSSRGQIQGSGRVQVRGGEAWNAEFAAKEVAIDKEILPVVASMFPLMAKAGDQLGGTFEGNFKLQGSGLVWEKIKPALLGDGKVALRGLNMPDTSLLGQIHKIAGGAGAVVLKDAGAEFSVKDNWLEFHRLSATGDKARYDLAGKVSLDGELALKMDLLPLVKNFGAGPYKEASKYVKELPVMIRGTTASPKLEAPDPKSFLQEAAVEAGKKEVDKLIEKIKPK